MKKRCAAYLALLGLLAACALSPGPSPEGEGGGRTPCAPTAGPCTTLSPDPALGTTSPEGEEKRFVVLAYATEDIVPAVIAYERLTHITYSFLIPNSDGTFAALRNPWKLKEIVSQAHAQDVKVLISVGGWGWDAQFESLAADPAKRAVFVQGLVALVAEYELDGVDLDWEYPDPGQSAQNFLALARELRQGLNTLSPGPGLALTPSPSPNDGRGEMGRGERKLLMAAVIGYGDEVGLGIPDEAFEVLDTVNLMAYEGPDHGTMAQAENSLNYWLGRGLPAEKAVLGLPFYGMPGGISYAKIVKTDPQFAQVDEAEAYGVKQLHYNGLPTVQAKTRLALASGGGVMFWALDHDSRDETSLLRAIDETVKQAQTDK